MPRSGRVAVLLNANAKRVTSAVRRSFERITPSEDLFFSRSLDEAASFSSEIIQRRYDVVLTGGGDGTLVQTLNLLLGAVDKHSRGLHRPKLPDIGILRLGTGNALAFATGAGHPIEDALAVLSGDVPRARPLSLVEEADSGQVHPFASLGYDAALLNDYLDCCTHVTSPAGKQMMKSVAGYFYALFAKTIPADLRAPAPSVRVVATGRASMLDPVTDEEIPLQTGTTLFEGCAKNVMWGTAPYYGFKMMVLPFAERRSDRFHLRVSTVSIPYLLGHLAGLWRGTLRTPRILDFLVEGARIESSVPLPYQTGGDGRGYRSSLEISLSPRTFRVLDRLPRAA
ncbi:MAG: hypothetical protein HY791_12925 [Deltaproteobacteria bacterium]|nr:hypothetical protein [Deltaproteobacteria bacterium]